MSRTPVFKDYFKLHFVIFIWGFTGVLGKLISIDGTPLAWIRMGVAFIGLGGYMLANGISFKTGRKSLIQLLGIGLIIAAHWVTFFVAIKVSNVSAALVCMSSAALFMSFLEPFILKKKIVPYEIIFGAIVIGALGLIFKVETQYALGIGLAIFSAFLGSLFTALNALYVDSHNATKITTFEMLSGFVGLTFFMFATDGFSSGNWIPTTTDWAYILVLGLVCTAYAFMVSVDIMKVISPFTVAISVNLEPIYAILMALVLFGEEEHMSPLFYVGGGMLILTILANAMMKKRARKRA